MTTLTTRLQIPIPQPGDPFKPVSVDLPAMGNRIDTIAARQPGSAIVAATVGAVGQVGQVRAGRVLTAGDFTVALSLNVPVGLWNLADLSDVSTFGRNLSNKGAVPFGVGILGAATSAAVFAGSTGQALYIADTGGADPFRLKTGSCGCWFRTAKRGTFQSLMTKSGGASPNFGWRLMTSTANGIYANFSSAGTGFDVLLDCPTDVCDDQWHHAVMTFDGSVFAAYVDGALEATVAAPVGSIFATSGPLNIGGTGGDGATACGFPSYGRVDEAFVTSDVLNLDQVRFLYALKVAHGYPVAPTRAHLSVVRKRRGAILVTTDFPATPLRLHNFVGGSLAESSGGPALTSNPSTGSIASSSGADGQRASAFLFTGAHQGLSATDAGLPAALASRSYGCWFKTGQGLPGGLVGWGTLTTADARLLIGIAGLQAASGSDYITGPALLDGLWHHAVVVEDNAAADGVKRKLYVDGRIVGGSTVMNSITLAGANRFRVGASPDGTLPVAAAIDGVFVYSGALTSDQVMVLYMKAQQAMLLSPKAEGDHIEGFDATSVYVINDILEPQYAVSLEVAA